MAEPVDAGTVVPGLSVDPGQNVLVTGPPMLGKESLALDLLAASFTETDAALVVSTMRPVSEALSDLLAATDAPPARFRGIDCVGEEASEQQQVSSVTSPSDLTGIGMQADRHMGELADAGYRLRVGLLSISTMLPLTEFRPVYRFLHVLTGRIAATDAIGVFVLDSEAHDERVTASLTALFDVEVRLRETADGGREGRVQAPDAVGDEWVPLGE